MKILKKITAGFRKAIIIILGISLYLPLLLNPPITNAQTTTGDPVANIQNLNQQLAQGLTSFQLAGSTTSATTSTNLVQIATDRRAKLKDLIVNQPKDVPKVLIGDTSAYPADVQSVLEKKTTESGYYARLHSDYTDNTESDADLLTTTSDLASAKVLLKSDFGLINYSNLNKQISVSGYKLDDVMWFGGADNMILSKATASTTSGPVLASANPPGTRSLAVFYVNFVDNRIRTLTDVQISNYIFGAGNSFKSFLEKSSNHLFTISGDEYPLDLDINKTCELTKTNSPVDGDLVYYTRTKAIEQGIDMTKYTDEMIILDPTVICQTKSGESQLGRGWAMSVGFAAIAHEFGHNMSLQHAQGYVCSQSFINNNCTEIGYGNPLDVMGGSPGDFNDTDYGPYAKEFLGWLQPSEITNVTANGTYTINTFEEPPIVPGPEYPARVLRLGLGSNAPAYYVAYRTKKKDLNVQGPVIELASGSLGNLRKTYLLDTTPGSMPGGSDVNDGYLHDGQQVTDPFNGITFKGISHDFSSATIQITFGQPAPGFSTLNVDWDMATGYLSAVGQKKDMSWSQIHYIVDVKCSGGFGCTGNWNQWSGCASWPTGTCPPFDTTNTSVDIPVGSSASGYSYTYRVWILTKSDNDPNQAATYQWIGDTDATTNCGGPVSCTKHLTWPSVTYKGYLFEKNTGLKACTQQVLPGVAGCQDFLFGSDLTSFSFHGLPTGITFKGSVKVSDFSGNLHLLSDFADMGQSDSFFRSCSNSTGVTCTLPGYPDPQSYIGYEPIIWSVKVGGQNGYAFMGPNSAIAFSNGSFSQNWKWDYYAVVFPTSYSDCIAAGSECQVQAVYQSTGSKFSFLLNGVRSGTNYRLVVCAYTCNALVGNPVIVDKIITSNPGLGPTFFTTDPFLQVADSDGDGFTDVVEQYIGTDPNNGCGVNTWPPDIDGDGTVSILDLAKIASAYGSKVGDAKYKARYDMDADGKITILDLSKAAGYFGKKCPAHVSLPKLTLASPTPIPTPTATISAQLASPTPSPSLSPSPTSSPSASPTVQATSSAN